MVSKNNEFRTEAVKAERHGIYEKSLLDAVNDADADDDDADDGAAGAGESTLLLGSFVTVSVVADV